MTASSTSTDWIREGAQVAEYRGGNPSTVTFATIARITATQVILDNGNRYRRDTCKRVGDRGSSFWGPPQIRPCNDSQVQAAAAQQAVQDVTTAATRIKVTNPDDALEALDLLARAISDARTGIISRKEA